MLVFLHALCTALLELRNRLKKRLTAALLNAPKEIVGVLALGMALLIHLLNARLKRVLQLISIIRVVERRETDSTLRQALLLRKSNCP